MVCVSSGLGRGVFISFDWLIDLFLSIGVLPN